MSEYYLQHEGKVIKQNEEFENVMAMTLDPKADYKSGVLRCITKREGGLLKGYLDRSELRKINFENLHNFNIAEKICIKNEEIIVNSLLKRGYEFIGFEDPDIWIDEEKNIHLYFTLPFLSKGKRRESIHLGHAVGKELNCLEMTTPVLLADKIGCAKEVCIVPKNSKGIRYNLVESSKNEDDNSYSVVRLAIAKDMSKKWKFGEILFHPKEHGTDWISGHASPGPLFPPSFIDVGPGKMLGLMNGRERDQISSEGETIYGIFSVGLFIYDYENGKIDWVSQEPLIRDTEAISITFASQFVETVPGEGILYAHIDDSFIRAYTIKAEWIKKILPNKK